MKISEYKGEEALELLANLIEPVSEIVTDKEIGTVWAKNRYRSIGIAIKKHKKAVISILAALDNVPVEEYKCNIFTLPSKILEVLNDPELSKFFTSQGQMGDATSSGSASENTEE